jgi:hypothetical protein
MAVAAAADRASLDRLTTAIRADGERRCDAGIATFCVWVPNRVAIVAERRAGPADAERWEPVR